MHVELHPLGRLLHPSLLLHRQLRGLHLQHSLRLLRFRVLFVCGLHNLQHGLRCEGVHRLPQHHFPLLRHLRDRLRQVH